MADVDLSRQARRGFYGCLAVSALALPCFIAWHSGRGFDLTDEASYLVAASQPWNLTLAASQSGHYLHLLFQLVGQDVQQFRLAGLGLLLLVSYGLAGVTGVTRAGDQDPWRRQAERTLIAVSAIGLYAEWIITPSYNWLTLISLMLVVITLQASQRQAINSPTQWAYLLALGVAGALTFLAKPPAGVLIAGAAVLWWAMNYRRYDWRIYFAAGGAGAIGTLLAHSVLMDGGLSATFDEMLAVAGLAALLEPQYAMDRVFAALVPAVSDLISMQWEAALAWWLVLPLVLALAFSTRLSWRILAVGVPLFLVAGWLEASWHFWQIGAWSRLGMGRALLTLTLMTGLAVSALWLGLWRRGRAWYPDRASLALTLLLIGAICAFVAGTNRTYLSQSTLALVFVVLLWLRAAAAVDHLVANRFSSHAAWLLLVCSIAFMVFIASRVPHRLDGPLENQTEIVIFPGYSSRLAVSPGTAAYLGQLQRTAAVGDWRADTLLIDMTGGTPGAAFYLRARSLPVPWLLGGYEGSNDYAAAVLQAVDRQALECAWLLMAPEGGRRLAPAVLGQAGLSFPGDFRMLGELKTGYRDERQVLYRPVTCR